jgi:hypothetical protein
MAMVKKAVKGVKSFAKSDLGKAALYRCSCFWNTWRTSIGGFLVEPS